MREIKELTSTLKEATELLKSVSTDARSAIADQMARARTNSIKVQSLIKDLKDANQEMEAFLSDASSNFQPDEPEQESKVKATDVNGVTINGDR